MKRGSWMWLLFGGGAFAALAAWRPRRASATPRVQEIVIDVPAAPPATHAGPRPHRYAGQDWTDINSFVRWVEERYGGAMVAAEEAVLQSQGYDPNEDWAWVQENDPAGWQELEAAIVVARRQALARAIQADSEMPVSLLLMMRWAKMTPGSVNEDEEMHRFATELDRDQVA